MRAKILRVGRNGEREVGMEKGGDSRVHLHGDIVVV